jgi:ribosome biogenesis GTPase / thiamine phosphate phosphatase
MNAKFPANPSPSTAQRLAEDPPPEPTAAPNIHTPHETLLQHLRPVGLRPADLAGLGVLLALAPPALGPDEPPPQLLRVTEVHRDSLTLHDGTQSHAARQLPALRTRLNSADDALAVGDWVLAARNAHGQWWVQERVPPRTQITRRVHAEGGRLQRAVIVSNVDTALLVMGLDGDHNPRRLARYLALARLAGVQPVVVLTKADLCPDEATLAARVDAVQRVLPPGVALLALNALGEAPRAALQPWLQAGQTLALLGSSGAGKSTLTNALATQALQCTGGTREGDGRGRHTTTARSLHRTPEGACIIDTPGLRALRLEADEAALTQSFGDVAALAPQCRFRNCRHEGEPGCAVAAALPPERVRGFHKLLREAQRDTMTALQRREQLAQWKARSRAARAHLAGKRGEGRGDER